MAARKVVKLPKQSRYKIRTCLFCGYTTPNDVSQAVFFFHAVKSSGFVDVLNMYRYCWEAENVRRVFNAETGEYHRCL